MTPRLQAQAYLGVSRYAQVAQTSKGAWARLHRWTMNWSSCFTWYADNILIILEAYRTIEFIFLDIAKVFRQFLKFFGRASSILAHSWCVCWGRSWSQNERLAILLFPPLLCQSDILLLSVDIVWCGTWLVKIRWSVWVYPNTCKQWMMMVRAGRQFKTVICYLLTVTGNRTNPRYICYC